MELHLAFCTSRAARYALHRWYYRDTLPVGKLVRIGVWEDRFCGVVIFGMSACSSLGAPYGLTSFECCELVRLSLGEHITPTSRVVAIALKMLKRQSPGIRAVVSYSDPRSGHLGIVYQAMGWIYTGTSGKDSEYIDKSGVVHHSGSVHRSGFKKKLGGIRVVARPQDCERVKLPGKHRYVWPFDDEVKARLLTMQKLKPAAVDSDEKTSLSEPRRAGSKEIVATLNPEGRGRCNSDPGAPTSP